MSADVMLDSQAAELVRRIEALPVPKRGEMTVEEARQATFLYRDMYPQAHPLAAVEDRKISRAHGDIGIRVYRNSRRPIGILIYFHGGGWTLGDLDTSDRNCRAFTKYADCVVISVDYRLAPEHPFPAGLNDAYEATRWVVQSSSSLGGFEDVPIGVGGESSGANLAAAVALRARDDGFDALAAQLLIYPPLAFSFDTPSYEEFGDGFVLTTKAMEWYWQNYVPDSDDRSSPYAAPLLAERLDNLPPALVFTAECDPLRYEGERYAARLLNDGVSAELVRVPGQIHGFFAFGGVARNAYRKTLQTTVSWLRQRFAANDA